MFLASKILPLLVYPLGIVLWGMLLAALLCWRGWRRTAGTLLAVLVLGLWVVSTPAFARLLIGSLEHTYPPRAIEDLPQASAIIVLGGAVGVPRPPRLTLDLHDASDRVLYAARLYRAGKAPFVLVTSGAIPEVGQPEAESPIIADLLVEWGVPRRAILLETQSRNTYENALETRRLVEAHGLGRLLLVTSALHMPRAVATFRRAGLDVIPAPTDVLAVPPASWTPVECLPNAGALADATRAIKEYLGLFVYRVRGWA